MSPRHCKWVAQKSTWSFTPGAISRVRNDCCTHFIMPTLQYHQKDMLQQSLGYGDIVASVNIYGDIRRPTPFCGITFITVTLHLVWTQFQWCVWWLLKTNYLGPIFLPCIHTSLTLDLNTFDCFYWNSRADKSDWQLNSRMGGGFFVHVVCCRPSVFKVRFQHKSHLPTWARHVSP